VPAVRCGTRTGVRAVANHGTPAAKSHDFWNRARCLQAGAEISGVCPRTPTFL